MAKDLCKRIDFEKALNPEQLETVQASDGPLFVLAAAGTGKTRTLVYRVVYLVEQGVDPRRILLLTFTNRAAREMLERAELLVGSRVGGLWGGTFHHMANRILRRSAHLLGYALDFIILDRDDSKALIRSCLDVLKLKDKKFPKPDVLIELFSSAINKRLPLEQVLEHRFAEHPVDIQDILNVCKLYNEKKHSLNSMDFDDLLVNSVTLFMKNPDLLAQYQDQFLYVLVDEYQDTNPIQAQWVDMISAKYRNLMVVGDDFQSIYSWRGADYRNILTFPERYPDARKFMLETNYRSVPEILKVANSCIAGNPFQFQKVLRATRDAYKKPVCALLHDGEHQASYIIEYINRLHRDGCALSEIAVLYRAHYHAMEFQLALARQGIPYIVTSGVRFFEQAHVKDVCSLLRILHNPGDELAFTRLLKLMPGVGQKTAEKIWRNFSNRFDADNQQQRKDLLKLLPTAARPVWKAIDPVLSSYKTENLNNDPAEVMSRFIKAFYDEYLLDTYDDYQRRLEDLQGMMLFITSFESVEDFLSEVALVTNLDAEPNRMDEPTKDCLRLSTVHQAKGLEWNAVFVLWATEGMFPSSRAMNEDGSDEEERRLFYVAVTRAKNELVLCSPQMRRTRDGGMNFLAPSRFICEIPTDNVEHVHP